MKKIVKFVKDWNPFKTIEQLEEEHKDDSDIKSFVRCLVQGFLEGLMTSLLITTISIRIIDFFKKK